MTRVDAFCQSLMESQSVPRIRGSAPLVSISRIILLFAAPLFSPQGLRFDPPTPYPFLFSERASGSSAAGRGSCGQSELGSVRHGSRLPVRGARGQVPDG